jgi:hypothetical protein
MQGNRLKCCPCEGCILSGMRDLLKKRSLRLFTVLTACWAFFCLFVQPILMAREGLAHYQNDLRFCYSDPSTQSEIQDCLSRARREFQAGSYAGFGVEYDKGHSWSYSWYFRVAWRFLMIEIIAPPLLVYGIVWIVASISIWIWRGSKAGTVTPPRGPMS